MGLFDNITNWVGNKINESKEKYEMVQQERAQQQEIINRKYEYVNWLLNQPEINDKLLERYMVDSKSEPKIDIPRGDLYKLLHLNYLWHINNDDLPQLDWSHVGIIPKKDEHLHYSTSAVLCEMKSKTTKINYGGLTGSIKIAKGVRYRWGSLNVVPEKTSYLADVANGVFFISNQRVGFVSQNKNFTFQIKKLMSVTFNPELGFLLYKENKDKPYILSLEFYETPAVLLSYLTTY